MIDRRLHRMIVARDADAIVARLEGLAHIAAGHFYLPGGDRDDLLQEARLGIVLAVRDFRGNPEAFIAFATLVARRRVMDAVSRATRVKHRPLNDAVGLDAPVPGLDDATLAEVIPLHGAEPIEQLQAREALEEALAVVLLELSELERSALVAVHVTGASYETAAATLGVNVRAVDNALQRAQQKLRDPEIRARAAARAVPDPPRRAMVYVPRRERFTPGGLSRDEAIAAARRHLGDEFATVVRCAKRGLSPDGQERRDTRGHPCADGRRPTAVWLVTLEAVA